MRIELFFDVLCPWCAIAERRLTTALERTATPEASVVLRAFELAPDLGGVPGPSAAEQMGGPEWWGTGAADRIALIQDLGAVEGIVLDLARARPVSTFDAHRLVQLAEDEGRGLAVLRLLLDGYHAHGENVADHDVLHRIGVAAGLDEAELRRVLDGTEYAVRVRTDEQRARALGITGVPGFLVDGRRLAAGVPTVDDLVGAFARMSA